MAQSASRRGVLLTNEAQSCGLSRKDLGELAADGLIIRELRGVYRVAGAPFGELERITLAATATGGVISHQTAARLWGFEAGDSATVHLTLRRGIRYPACPWVHVHSTTRSLAGLTVTRDEIELTKPMRTLLDVAAQPATSSELEDLFGYVVSHKLVSVAAVKRFVRRANQGTPGAKRLRNILEAVDLSGAESVAEVELLRVLARAGIEAPETQYRIYHDGRFVARVDVAWPRWRVAVEVDGYRYHSDPRTFTADRERGNLITIAGWTLLRTAPATLRDHPERICSDVTEAFGQRRHGQHPEVSFVSQADRLIDLAHGPRGRSICGDAVRVLYPLSEQTAYSAGPSRRQLD
jgi:predicted transcriptional regulator of viral defense system